MNPDLLSAREIIILASILFGIGVLGVVTRRNLIVILMAAEIMLNSVNLLFVAFSRVSTDNSGQIMVFFVMAIAAAEAAIGLAIIITIFRNTQKVTVDAVENLKS